MGFLETEERESLEIGSHRYEEVDTLQSDQLQGDRTPSPISSETSFLNNTFQNNIKTSTNSFANHFSTPWKLGISFSMRNSSASLSFSYSIVIIFLITIIFGGMIMHSFFYHQRDPKGCNISSMYPSYIRQDNFDSEQTRFAGKYSLYLYRDRVYDNDQPTGIPALFIPGNAGSYKQARSIASETSVIFSEVFSRDPASFEMGVSALDFFTGRKSGFL